jgi:hypothetical protein
MKKASTIFLQIIVVLTGIAVFAFLLLEPQFEGRNVNATLFEIYFNDVFLMCAYAISSAFFIALYQAFKLLGYVRQNNIVSQDSVRALRTIKYCALFLASCLVCAEAHLLIVRPGDDIAGGVAMSLFIIIASAITAATADMFEGLLWGVDSGIEKM